MWVKYYRPIKARDVDNGYKQIGDCLQGFVYENDKQVNGLFQMRYDTQPKNPRCEVLIHCSTDKEMLEKAVRWFVYGTEES